MRGVNNDLAFWLDPLRAGVVMVPHAEMRITGEEVDLRKGKRDGEFCLRKVGLKYM